MSIRYRPMEPIDAQACAAVVARHPVIASRYGTALQHLAATWLKLLGSDGFVAAVFEEQKGTSTTVLGAGVATFITDAFLLELKRAPHFWIGPEIVLRTHRGKSPVLSGKQVREANTLGGLNVAVWHTGVLPESIPRPEIGHAIMTSFLDLHRGFLLKEVVFQAETLAHMEGVRSIGSFLWKDADRSYERVVSASETFLGEPHVMGVTRELASGMSGVWGASMFLHDPPRFFLSRSEQRLLSYSLNLGGGTDQEIADRLGISLVAVKKKWRAIYERAGTVLPELAPRLIASEGAGKERGKGKKHRLLAYVREHPEELRPVSRKLIYRLPRD